MTTDETRASVLGEFGIEDGGRCRAESFAQWVLEDTFPRGRPPCELVGVQMVDDVEPYELMKLRLLNASHQAMGYFGNLAGERSCTKLCRDPLFAGFLLDYMRNEAIPTLRPVPGIDLDAYCRELIDRFCNARSATRSPACPPRARSASRSGCCRSSGKTWPKGGAVRLSAAIFASWARYDEATDEQGQPIAVVDRYADELIALANAQRADPTVFIRNTLLFGDLAEQPRFVDAYLETLRSLHERGSAATLASLTAPERTYQ